MTLTNLQESILKKYPEASSDTIQELCSLIDQYKLEYLSGKDGGAVFIVSRLSQAKGLSPKDFKNYIEKGTPDERNAGSTDCYKYKLTGRFVLLSGEQLRVFKTAWAKEGNRPIASTTSSVWVTNWEGAYAYLVQGASEVAKDMQSLAARSIQRSAEPNSQGVVNPTSELTKSTLRATPWTNEEELSAALAWLAAQSPYNLQVEISIKDFPESKCSTRRIDLIHETITVSKSGRVVTAVEAYELKKDCIDLEDVEEVANSKRYRELVKRHYGTPYVKFFLVAFSGGTAEALERVKEFEDIEILTVAQLTEFLLSKIAEWHKEDAWYTRELRKSSPIVNKLLTPCKELPAAPVNNVIPFTSRPKLKKAG